MIRYMLDTNTCIYIIKQKPMQVIERFKQLHISQVCMSSITLSALAYGVMKSSKPEQNHVALAQFAGPMEQGSEPLIHAIMLNPAFPSVPSESISSLDISSRCLL